MLICVKKQQSRSGSIHLFTEGEKQHGQARVPGGVCWMRCSTSGEVKFEKERAKASSN
jgi:hypothetical protein